MAKTVFRPTEITKSDQKVLLKLSHTFETEPEEPEAEEIPEYVGPTADDLRREAELFKKNWETEKQKLLADAEVEAQEIVKKAEQSAFDEVKRKTDQAAVIKKQAEDEAARIIKDAENRSLDIIQEAERRYEKNVSDARKEGFDKGHEDGYQTGRQEVLRLINRLHVIVERTMDRRKNILEETEQQIVDLVLLISRKVVKIISENQRNVIMSNVLHALRKVKGRGDVTIRVNLADMDLTSEHVKDFIESVESVKSITIAEDSAVDKGGCIVETDFGSIDARISSQLAELEQKILEISPIRNISGASVVERE
ncbi:flagellar assembly protein FliH [Treponema sp. OMZ 840]|uniref:flagellar assembly protein FliH n=1 Tax=Treponema sp. OMZ 840 TaxID=244313 RepID=UPI003D927A1A